MEPKRLIDHLIGFCISMAACAFLLRLAARWLAEAAPLLLACAAFIIGAVLGYRLIKRIRDMGKW